MPAALTSALWITFSALTGLLIGSFLNVCIYRLPAGLTIVRGHSLCPNCRHSLGALDLIPVLSYLFLGRRCRYCAHPIASRYMWIELLTGAYFALAAAVGQPGRYEPPAWLSNISDQAAPFHMALAMLVASVLAFSSLLVWAMISWDHAKVPAGVLIVAAFPALLRVLLRPDRLLSHLSAILLAVLFVVFVGLLRLVPQISPRLLFAWSAGLILIALAGGLQVTQAVLAVMLAELLLIALSGIRGRSGAKQEGLLWRSLPLQALVVGSVLWLFL